MDKQVENAAIPSSIGYLKQIFQWLFFLGIFFKVRRAPPLARITLVGDNCAVMVTLLLNTTYGNPNFFLEFSSFVGAHFKFHFVVGHRVESMAALVSEYTLEVFTLLNARGKKELIENGV
ncbi:hypothetical protein TNCV_1565361 [Trichonephila clavipes]|nr:hypothetical protein TNCV_1565361 [Trichonephila clavipes]